METPLSIPVPLPHIGSIDTSLVRGEPLMLVDTGPRADEALSALEPGLGRAGAYERAAPDGLTQVDRRFSLALMRHHGVHESVIAMPLRRLLTGHGDELTAHAELVDRRVVDGSTYGAATFALGSTTTTHTR